jgi:anti-sigma B factor antagonist
LPGCLAGKASTVNFELSASLAESQLVVAIRGQLDTFNAALAVAALAALVTVGQLVILDLAALDFIDCFALRALTEMKTRLRLSAGDVLVAAPTAEVQRLLALTRLDAWFSVHLTVAAAVASTRSMSGPLATAIWQHRPAG